MALCLAPPVYGQAEYTYEVLKAFDAAFPKGASPYAGVIQASDGKFYGTTDEGGAFNRGTVFRLDATGMLTTLMSFTGGSGGAYPVTGRYTYTPQVDAQGADAFTFHISDGVGLSNVATITVAITGANDAPTAQDTAFTTSTDLPLVATLPASDADGDALTFTLARALGEAPSPRWKRRLASSRTCPTRVSVGRTPSGSGSATA